MRPNRTKSWNRSYVISNNVQNFFKSIIKKQLIGFGLLGLLKIIPINFNTIVWDKLYFEIINPLFNYWEFSFEYGFFLIR